jgi:type IV pilus assembly protein PilP
MIKRNNHYLLSVFMIAWLSILVGCKQNEQPPPPPPAVHSTAVKVRPPVQKQQSTAKATENLAPSSDFSNRKDPFKSFVAPQAQAAKPMKSAKAAADLLPIQSYDLSKFKVAGIIVGLKENRALVIDPAGKGYVLKQGMLIGDNDGRISRITATTVEVVENYRDDNGRISKRTVKLTLPQKK